MMKADVPLWEQEPSESELAAAARGALVPAVAIWKSRTGKEMTPVEQLFSLGYAYGMDDRLMMQERAGDVLDEAVEL